MASASAAASFGGTSKALTSLRAISRQPGTSVATIGLAQAAASSMLNGRPSRNDGSTAICARAQNAPMSPIWPSKVSP